MIDQLLTQTREKMKKAVDATTQDLSSIRSGRATPALVENIVISAYGGTTPMKVMELATITSSDAKTLIITPFDPSVLPEIEKGLLEANTGLTPVVDGEHIRINLPSLTEERRKEFIKLAKAKIEAGKVMIRQVRQESMHQAKMAMDNNTINEDQKKMIEKQIQEATDKMVAELDGIGQRKEQELLQI